MKLLDLKENDKMDLDSPNDVDLKFDDFELCLKGNKCNRLIVEDLNKLMIKLAENASYSENGDVREYAY